MVDNWQDRANTIHLLVLCDGDVTLWRTYDVGARPDPSEDPPQGAVIDDLPDERTDCRVVARLNDGETAEIDLAEHDLDCTELHVQAEPAERGGGLTIFHRIDGECE